jgi:hypothetical protein
MKKKTTTNTKGRIKRPFFKNPPIVGVIKDIQNYRAWIKTIQAEAFNPNSKFNKFGLDFNFFYVLYMPVSLPQEDAVLPENIKRLRLIETLAPVHQYLDGDLGFAGSIVPEFNQFYDEEGNPTLVYGIVYRFAFDTLSLKWVVSRTLFTGALIFALLKWPIISWVFDTIKGLF